jgi:hypothetical protein
MRNSACTKNSESSGNSLGLLSSDTIWPSVSGLTLTKHVSRAIRVRHRRAFGSSGVFRIDSAVMNRTTSRQADCYYFSVSEGNSDAEVAPEAAGSQTPSVLILRSLLLMENHEKPA